MANFDVPGEYLHAEIPKYKRILMKLRRDFVYIMCQVKPEYEQHVRYENGKKVLYILVLRVLYCCIEYALLWYNIFSTTLEVLSFEINPFDRCVANKVIEGTQCTIAWYMDENKLSHTCCGIISSLQH